MSAIVKQARIRHTFDGEESSGWIPPHAAMPPRAPARTVDLLVLIRRTMGGFRLAWIGPASEFCGHHWYVELPYIGIYGDFLATLASM